MEPKGIFYQVIASVVVEGQPRQVRKGVVAPNAVVAGQWAQTELGDEATIVNIQGVGNVDAIITPATE